MPEVEEKKSSKNNRSYNRRGTLIHTKYFSSPDSSKDFESAFQATLGPTPPGLDTQSTQPDRPVGDPDANLTLGSSFGLSQSEERVLSHKIEIEKISTAELRKTLYDLKVSTDEEMRNHDETLSKLLKAVSDGNLCLEKERLNMKLKGCYDTVFKV